MYNVGVTWKWKLIHMPSDKVLRREPKGTWAERKRNINPLQKRQGLICRVVSLACRRHAEGAIWELICCSWSTSVIIALASAIGEKTLAPLARAQVVYIPNYESKKCGFRYHFLLQIHRRTQTISQKKTLRHSTLTHQLQESLPFPPSAHGQRPNLWFYLNFKTTQPPFRRSGL